MKSVSSRYKKYIFPLVLLLAMGALWFVSGGTVGAQDGDTFGVAPVAGETILSGTDIRIVVARIIRAVLGLLGVLALGIVLYAGFLYLTSRGNEETVAEARRILVNGFIGLVIILTSFSITQFVLNRLSEATESGVSGSVPAECEDPVFANDNPELCESGSFECREDRSCCSRNRFVVLALTPNTRGSGTTNMNNAVVRAVFSQSVNASAAPDSVFTITRANVNVNAEFRFAFVADSGRRVLEAVPIDASGFIPAGNYEITVNEGLTDENGEALADALSCGSFPQQTSFTVTTTGVIDAIRPAIASITVNGREEDDVFLPRGETHIIEASLTDNSGIGYVHLRIARDNASGQPIIMYDGPAVERGSDATSLSPYIFTYPLVLAENTPTLERYTVTLTAFDLDNNSQIATTHFVIVGSHCDNGVLDGDETQTDLGGSCPDNGSCTADWQCASHECDEASQLCVASPIITNVSPWDGATGNWVTIEGRFFGESVGTVLFGIDGPDANTVVDDAEFTIPAAAAQCAGTDGWHETYIVAEVPGDGLLPPGSRSAIRVLRADNPSYADSTVDETGPSGWEESPDGLFTKNTISRPGLCVADPAAGASGESLRLLGRGFAPATEDNDIFFGGIAAGVDAVSVGALETEVPRNMQAGRVGVSVTVDGEASNGLPFVVLSEEQSQLPVIAAVAPTEPTPNSYITISGERFGSEIGFVYLAPSRNTICTPSNPACIQAVATLPSFCGDTWDDRQIIVQIPPTTPLGTYAIFVQNTAGNQSLGDHNLIVRDGDPLPSLCLLQPASGPAPLPSDRALNLYGVNISDNPTLSFWRQGAVADNLVTWLTLPNAPVTRTGGEGVRVAASIPVDTSGHSMQSGPIVLTNTNAVRSNPVRYTVEDCRAAGTADEPNGYHCCSEGPDAGRWVGDAFSCTGEAESAGYVWRFTTGRIPHVPSVVESCDADNWGPGADIPSPSPWERRPTGISACLNAAITVSFDMSMDTASFDGNVRVYTCGTDDDPACDDPADITNEVSLSLVGNTLMVRTVPPVDNLATSTWYRVMLLTGIQSEEEITVLGTDQIVHVPLLPSRPCGRSEDGRDSAYCFDFKTDRSGDTCELSSVGITPDSHTTNILGPLLTPSNNPLYYLLWGRADEACTVLNVDGQGWNWSVVAPPGLAGAAIAAPAPDGSRYTDTRAAAEALLQTAPRSVEIQAQRTRNPLARPATSQLTIDIGTPRVMEYWPNCGEVCVNATIGARFNRQMFVEEFTDGNVRLYRCPDERCFTEPANPSQLYPAENVLGSETLRVSLDIAVDEQTPVVLSAVPGEPLLPNTWYQVELGNSIHAIGGYDGRTDPPTPVLGNGLEPFIWKFRTKENGALCNVDSVRVEPHPFTAYSIGEKTRYAALAFGSPDACSPIGQRLNSNEYGWNWTTADPPVATVSQFLSLGRAKPYCTTSCLPRGADVSRLDQSPVGGLCGNGLLEAGEDCDIAAFGETPGRSCALNCLRPGNPNAGVGTGQCGNGVIDENNGEECDSEDRTFCTAVCTNPGSRPFSEYRADQGSIPYCGSGSTISAVTAGEDCETGVTIAPRTAAETIATCSASCQHTGTPLRQAWCDEFGNTPIAGIPARDTSFCQDATSVCGNAVIEADEDCEVMTVAGVEAVYIYSSSDPTTRVLQSTNLPHTSCNASCLLERICDPMYGVPPHLRCEPGTPGCDPDHCTFLGSSVSYSESSLCGDGVVGVGESPWCEFTGSDAAARQPSVAIQNSVQAVTAVGQGTMTSGVQSTAVRASAVAGRQVVGGRIETRDISESDGEGSYTLQCGFEEYGTPRQIGSTGDFAYNNCPDSGQGRTMGVAENSCCYPRLMRTAEYPVDGQGVGASDDVCRNTNISVTFDGDIDEATLINNLLIARGETRTTACGTDEVDVSNLVRGTLAVAVPREGFFPRMWGFIRDTVGHLFAGVARATEIRSATLGANVWCVGRVSGLPSARRIPDPRTGIVAETEVSVAIRSLLEANTPYAVFLRGGTSGIKDVNGVGIWSSDTTRGNPGRDDSFVFYVGNQVCRLDRVVVEPDSHVFTAPNTGDDRDSVNTREFTAAGLTARQEYQEEIVPTTEYDWDWSWTPTADAIVNIPADARTNREPTITIRSREVQGEATAFAHATITADPGGQTGTIFSGTSHITSLFCERPWPPLEYYPYEDGNPPGRAQNDDGFDRNTSQFDGSELPPVVIGTGGAEVYFNISMGYCADAGASGDRSDDLPYLHPVIEGNLAGAPPTCTPPEVLINRVCVPPPPTCDVPYILAGGSCTTPPQCPSGQTYSSGTCSVPPGGQYNPRHLGSIAFAARTTPALNQPVSVAYARIQGAEYAFFVGGGTLSSALQIADVSNPTTQAPRIVATEPLDPTTDHYLSVPNQVSVVERHDGAYNGRFFAYVINSSTPGAAPLEAGFHVIEVTDPSAPQYASTFTMPDARMPDGTFSQFRPQSMAISPDGTLAFVIVHTTGPSGNVFGGDGILVLDVSDPQNITLLDTVTTGVLNARGMPALGGPVISRARRIVVTSNRAYVISNSQGYLTVLDISNPRQVTYIARLNDAQVYPYLDDPTAMELSDNLLRLYVLSGSLGMMGVFNISSDTLTETGRLTDTRLSRASDISIYGTQAVVATYASGGSNPGIESIALLDIRNDSSIQWIGALVANDGGARLSTSPNAIALNDLGTTAYATVRIPGNLEVADLTPPSPAPATCPGAGVRSGDVCTMPPECPSPYVPSGNSCVRSSSGGSPGGGVPGLTISGGYKQFLFLNDKNNDAIGLQIFDNTSPIGGITSRFSAREWLRRRLNGPIPPAFRDITVDGYDAVTDGNTYYINALNTDANNAVYHNIYLLGINPDADESTHAVFEALLDSFSFNINMTDFGYCSNPGEPDPNQPTASSDICSTDFDCPAVADQARVCANAKTKLQRDVERLTNIREAQDKLDAYRIRSGDNTYPKLAGGSFIPGYSASKWPSWGRLGALVGGLSADPVNQWEDCGGADTDTCWNPATAQFICPARSQVYEYRVSDTGSTYYLYTPFEYLDGSAAIVADMVDLGHFVDGQWCIPSETYTPTVGSCGDTVVNSGEECDPPGARETSSVGYVPGRSYNRCEYTITDRECATERDCARSELSVRSAYIAGESTSSICMFRGRIIYTPESRIDSGTEIMPYQCRSWRDCETALNAAPRWQDRILEGWESARSFSERAGEPDVAEIVCNPITRSTQYVRTGTASCLPPEGSFLGTCPSGQTATRSCSVSCTTEYTNCTANAICGNGRVEAGEACDDGARNGTYGHCNSSCTAAQAEYCGNGTLERPQEYCERTDNLYDATGFCLKESCRQGRYHVTDDSPVGTFHRFRSGYFLDASRGWALNDEARVGDPKTLYAWDGTRWSVLSSINNTNGSVNDVFFINENDGWVAGGNNADFIVWTTADGGASFTQRVVRPPGTPSTIGFNSIHFADVNRGWAAGRSGVVAKTEDSGVNWSAQIIENSIGNPVGISDVFFVSTETGIIVGDSGHIGRSIDGGDTWTTQDAGTTQSLNAVFFANPLVGWIAGNNGTILKTIDGGVSWFVPNANAITGNINDIRFVDENVGFIVGTGGVIYTTRDGGATWTLQTLQTSAGVAVPADSLYAVAPVSSDEAWAFGFTGFRGTLYRLTADPYCSRIDSCTVENSTASPCQYGDMCAAVADPLYHASGANACAIDCQGPGGYCGDGLVHDAYEECDDGNTDNQDVCSNFCFVQAGGPVMSVGTPSGSCGDSVVQTAAGERCDLGTQNGIACSPSYGRSCTYCSQDCRQILTVDPAEYCGNGAVESQEACDVRADGVVVSTTASLATMCAEVGTYSCSIDCAEITNTCTNCGARPLNAGGVTPRVSILNPMTGGNSASAWADNICVGLYEPGPFGDQPVHPFIHEIPSSHLSPFSLGNGQGIESDLLCRDTYYIRGIAAEGDTCALDSFTPGDGFTYQVAGEGAVVDNEFVFSPPVQPSVFRIVVRWTDDENERGARFQGLLYNEAFAGQGESSVLSYTQAYTSTFPPPSSSQAPVDIMCDSLSINNAGPAPYWWPNGCDGDSNGLEDSIYIHPIGSTAPRGGNPYARLSAQAMTVVVGAGTAGTANADANNTLNTNYAFFVSALNGSIHEYRNSNLTVEVYGNHAGQDTLNSVYRPIAVFEVAPTANTSINATSQYWHVFNFVRDPRTGTYALQRFGASGPDSLNPNGPAVLHGSIEAGFADVQCNIPGHFCSQL